MCELSTQANEIEQCMLKASDIHLELGITIKMIRNYVSEMNSTDFDEIALLAKLLDVLHKDTFDLSSKLYSINENINEQKAA